MQSHSSFQAADTCSVSQPSSERAASWRACWVFLGFPRGTDFSCWHHRRGNGILQAECGKWVSEKTQFSKNLIVLQMWGGGSLAGCFSPGCWFEFQALGRGIGELRHEASGEQKEYNLVDHAVNNLSAFTVISLLITVKYETE